MTNLSRQVALLLVTFSDTANGNFRKAEATYAQATDLVSALLKDLLNPRHKNTLIGTMGRVFQGHFELALIGLKDREKAFQILESAKARGLVDLLRGLNRGPLSTSTWDPRPARQVAVLQRELSTEEDSDQRRLLLDRLWEMEQRSWRLSKADAGSQEARTATPVSVQQLQSRLATGELVIEYVLGPARSFALAISRDRTAHHELKNRRQLEFAVESHRAAVQGKTDGRAEAKALYQRLLQPVTMLGQSKRVVIVPDGKLNLVAFGALVDSNDGYVVESRVISYAPSATVYWLLSRPMSSRTVQMAMLGVGGARYSSPGFEDIPWPVRGFGLFNPSSPPRWSAIPQSLAEVNDVAASQTGKTLVLTGDNATEADLKRLSLSNFRVLHLVLHSTIDGEFPDRSALVFTSQKNGIENGLLQAREIVSLYLNAELVTLAACDAGTGTIEGIAGMNSLLQAFMMAGSRSVVASIWPADDIFTAALMRKFYGNLRQGFDKAEALTLANR